MKIRFIYPRFEKLLESRTTLGDLSEKANLGNFKMPPALGIPILAALTPECHECCVFDENIEEIDYNDDSDLIAVSFFTPQAVYAYEIAKKFKEKGKTVIAGGMHPSLMKDEAAQYFDAVCVGEAETVWKSILTDFEKGELKQFYYDNYPDLKHMPIPKRNIFKNKNGYDWEATLIQVMRGCSFKCETCILPSQTDRKFRFRPVENVIEDIQSLEKPDFYLTDDSLLLSNIYCKRYLTELMSATSQLNPKPKMFLSGSLYMKDDAEYLDMLVKGGVVNIYIVTGCDPISIKAFQRDNSKYFTLAVNIVKKLKDAGINVFLSQGLGFDFHDEYVFDATLEFCQKAQIDAAEFYMLTPFPQTPSWHRFKEENRILHYNWTKYNTANVVFKPKNFTEQSLLDGYLYCWKEFYKETPVENTLNIF